MLGIILSAKIPPYFDQLIAGFHEGVTGRFVHLGHWDDPANVDPDSSPDDFERAQSRLNEIMLDMAELKNGQNILDAGCGFGGTLEVINERFRNMHLTGCNIDPRQLDICRQIRATNDNSLQWLDADACRLPLPDASMDRIFCIEAMFHFPSRRRFFTECARVLRQGGILVASDILLTQVAEKDGGMSVTDIVSAIRAGFGPWPDPWNTDGDCDELGRAAGLWCTAQVDATLNTRRSHFYTAPRDTEIHEPLDDSMHYATTVLKWLHEGDRLRYLYLRFVKP